MQKSPDNLDFFDRLGAPEKGRCFCVLDYGRGKPLPYDAISIFHAATLHSSVWLTLLTDVGDGLARPVETCPPIPLVILTRAKRGEGSLNAAYL